MSDEAKRKSRSWKEVNDVEINLNAETSAYVDGLLEIVAESAAKIAALEQQLAAMTADRNLWQDQHNGDCPNLARVTELERRCLIAERVIDEAELKVGPVWMAFVLAERQLIAEGKLPQIEVKP